MTDPRQTGFIVSQDLTPPPCQVSKHQQQQQRCARPVSVSVSGEGANHPPPQAATGCQAPSGTSVRVSGDALRLSSLPSYILLCLAVISESRSGRLHNLGTDGAIPPNEMNGIKCLPYSGCTMWWATNYDCLRSQRSTWLAPLRADLP